MGGASEHRLVAMNANVVTNLQDELETMGKSETRSFALNDMKVVMPDANTAIVTCQAKLDGSFSGSDISGVYNCATTWRMTNGVARRFPHRHKGGVETVRVIGHFRKRLGCLTGYEARVS